MRIKIDSQLKHMQEKEIVDKSKRCGERKRANGWRQIQLNCGVIIRLHIRYYCCFMEGYSIYIGKASTLYCRRARIIIKIISTLHAGFVVSVHRMITVENGPVDPDNIQGSHRPISFMRIKRILTRANDLP